MSIPQAISEILNNDATVQAAIDSFIYDSVEYYMIFNDVLLPPNVLTGTPAAKVNEALTTDTKTIMFYNAAPISGGLPYVDTNYTISCRAKTYSLSETIQLACYDALNRVKSSDGCSYFVATIEQIIPPRDDNDNYNAVLTVKSRGSKKQL